jgi:hypothetical protein
MWSVGVGGATRADFGTPGADSGTPGAPSTPLKFCRAVMVKNNYLTGICTVSKSSSYVRRIDFGITQLKA